ncbi:type II toxin-antitoxin system HipA family toxin [Rhodopseudomonas sp.]|uniref:type II toxin-antitoxin system HipA family toxin n=1 Tax=Rhodopseudomonas sp. TaxID=1078 RepID=UPI0039E3F1A2
MSVSGKAAGLGIYLRPTENSSVRVGSLYRNARGAVTFTVDRNYVALGTNRPILSLAWQGRTEEDTKSRLQFTGDKITQGAILPPFFENLLPEGALLDLVRKEFGAGAFDNFDVLSRLGHDLPGAVVAVPETGEAPPDKAASLGRQEVGERIHFSLAGIQLKFSMTRSTRGSLTLPVSGAAGDLILKTPNEKYPHFPEAEFTALSLARAAGIRTVEAALIDADQIEGIDENYLGRGQKSLVVTRFDRAAGGKRIHIEDFAQVLGSIHDQKYSMANQATVVKLAGLFSSAKRIEMLEAIRRLVVDIIVGNSDSHLKNWSFILPDGVNAMLSPAYDIMPFAYYGNDTMALEFGKTKNPTIVNLKRFNRLAGLVGIPEKVVFNEVKQTVEKALDVWPGLVPNLPAPPGFLDKLIGRWNRLLLVEEIRTPVFQSEPDSLQEEIAAERSSFAP